MRRWPLASALLLAGCSLAPRYEQPAPPIYAAYPELPEAGQRTATEISWENFFGDPLLKFYIAAALENNRDLAAATARIAQARALYRVQASSQLPQVDGAVSGARSRSPTAIGPVTSEAYTAQIAIASFEVDFWGRLANLSEAARLQYLATSHARDAFRLTLIRNLASVYYAIRSGEEGIALAERTVVSRRKAQRIARLRLSAGVTSAIDYEQASILVTQAETQLEDLQRTTQQQRNLLLVLIGGPTRGQPPSGRSILEAEQFADLDPGLPSLLLVNRPDLLAAEEQLRAAHANIGAARAAFFPRISLTGAAGFVSPELSALFDGDSGAWSYGGGAGLPIFDFGRRRAILDQSWARRDELVALYQRTVQEAFREVSDGLVARGRLDAQIAAQERAVEAQRRLARKADLRYDNGVSPFLEVLDAERNLFTAEQQLIQLRAAALQNGAALYTALGGGGG